MKVLISALLIACIASSCREAVFVPDKTDPRLPAYTEKGNQIGGALINNVAWQTDYTAPRGEAGAKDVFFIFNYPAGDSIKIQLQGEINEGADKSNLVYLDFIISHLQVRNPTQVPALNGRTFLLDGKANYAVLEDFDGTYSKNKRSIVRYGRGTGELTINRVKELTNITFNSSGFSYHPSIVSGTFRAKIPKDSTTIEVTAGRFDFIYP